MRPIPTAVLGTLLAAGLLAAGCGPNEAAIQREIQEATTALVKKGIAKDRDAIKTYYLPNAGIDNPIAAQSWDTKEGRAEIQEKNYKDLRYAIRDSGIDEKGGEQKLLGALKVYATGSASGRCEWEFKKDEKSVPELFWMTWSKTDQGWKVSNYERKMLFDK